MNRREFIMDPATDSRPKNNVEVSRTLTGLTPYTGTWTTSEVKHLLRRTMFSANKADVDYFHSLGLTGAINELLSTVNSSSPPLYTSSLYADPNVPLGQTWVNAPFDSIANTYRRTSYRSWWIGLMINQSRSITEKMVLFWHNHFSTEVATIGDVRYAYNHNVLLRQYALGNFKNLTKAISIDPSMLKYLNGYLNTNSAPDENYGRELQELFTVGKDANGQPYYTEDDVRYASKILTGYRIDAANVVSYFDSTRHDTTDKYFSAYYNNTIVSGQSGSAGQNELDDLLNMIFAAPDVALNICRKLYRFFVYYEIDAAVEANVIQPLAQLFRSNNYDILPVLDALFSSEHFFDILNRGAIIKSPTDFLVAACRDFNVIFPDATSYVEQYGLWNKIYSSGSSLGQAVGDPPNVAGWPAYYSAPQYHELWINASTLPTRNAFTDRMSANGYASGSSRINFDFVTYTESLTNPSDPNLLIAEVIDRHYCFDVSQTLKDFLKGYLLSGQITDAYWTIAWNDYVNAPANTSYYNIVQTRLKGMYQYLLELAEYQLS